MDEEKSYRELLREKLGKDYGSAVKSYDVIGSIAIIGESGKMGRAVAESIMKANSRVKTVLNKAGAVKGRYRKRKFGFVAGKRNYMAEYRENGAVFRFDIRKTFFSPRLAHERKRVIDLSKDRERVVVMFAGIGPFAIEIAKKNRNSEVIAIELNKDSYNYMLENIKLNKTSNVKAVLGDVRKAVPSISHADRIIMPLPMKAHEFLGLAIGMAGNGCTVHYYSFGPSSDPFAESIKLIRSSAIRSGITARIISTRVVRPYSAGTREIAVDFRVGRKRIRKRGSRER